MKRFSWPRAFLWGFLVLIAGVLLFIFIGSNLDYSCSYTHPTTGICPSYNGFRHVVNGYSNLWLQLFAHRCVGAKVPDDCLGPSGAVMMLTLFGLGFLAGGFLYR